jgi:hypothetical protein
VLTGLGLVRFTAGAFLAVSVCYVVASWLALPVFGLVAVPVVCAIAQVVYLAVSLPVAFGRMERGIAHVAN